jgi:hypothetical protein
VIEFDATDLRLLDLLQTDASLSNQALAERAHTSPGHGAAPGAAAGGSRRDRAPGGLLSTRRRWARA